MNWFKDFWFKSSEREALKERIKELEKQQEIVEESYTKPYSKLMFTGNNVMIVGDGFSYQSEGDEELFEKLKNSKSRKEIEELLFRVEQSNDVISFEKDDLFSIRENSDFLIDDKNNIVYLNPVKIALPPTILMSFLEICEKNDENYNRNYNTLKRFWYKLCKSTTNIQRDDVLRFCKQNDIRISKRGNIIAYRAFNKTNAPQGAMSISEFDKFVQENYTKIRRQKKGTSKFYVFQEKNTENYSIKSDVKHLDKKKKWKNLGSLKELKENITISPASSEQWYTSWHNPRKYIIRIGDIYKLVDEEPNCDPNICCAGGLHAVNVSYNYSSFGDTNVVTLIDPSKTLCTPNYDSGKLRTAEMKVVCLNPNPLGVHIDESLIEQADEEYDEYTIEQLEEAVRNKTLESLSMNKCRVEDVSLTDIKEIIKLLKDKTVLI